MAFLQTVLQHRPVDCRKHSSVDLDHEVRTDAEDVQIERCVVDLAHGQPVWHHGIAVGVMVGQDVGGVEQGWVA